MVLPIIVWGGITVVGAYMTYREMQELNKKDIGELRKDITPLRVIKETQKLLTNY